MDVLFTHCAGLDVHKKTVMACRVPPDPVLLQKPVFDTFGENRVSIFQRVTAVKNRTF